MGCIKAAVHQGIDLPMEQALAVERKYGIENSGPTTRKRGSPPSPKSGSRTSWEDYLERDESTHPTEGAR